jgi:hypothetical protein
MLNEFDSSTERDVISLIALTQIIVLYRGDRATLIKRLHWPGIINCA